MTTAARRIPVRYFALMLNWLRAQGTDTQQLLQMAGIEAQRFDRADATLLPDEIDRFIAASRRLTGRTDLGFEIGRLIKLNSHDILGYGMLSCQTLDQMLRLVARYYHLMNETFGFAYQRRGATGEVVYTPLIAMPLEMLRFLQEALATAHENQMRMALGGNVKPYDFTLSMPKPPHHVRYLELAPARFDFDERGLPGVRVVMHADLLDAPMPMPSPQVVRQVEERCEALASRPKPDGSGWGAYVTMMLREAGAEQPTLEEIAQRLNVSTRTIDRQLKKEQLQFRDLSQQVRFERACDLLADAANTVAQVGERLGFSDAANFSRAFKRFIGVAPSEYQRRQSSRTA
jgi:AraC-like DNA-binding protein